MMKTKTNKHGNNAVAALAEIDAQIQELNRKKLEFAEPLKLRFMELHGELLTVGNQIRELDSNWTPPSLKPKADEQIRELISANGPQTESEIVKALGDTFTKWKLKQALQKKFTADSAGRFSPKD